MPNFNKWVKNVTSTMDFAHSTEWEFPIEVPSSMKTVEAIVRQIAFVPDIATQSNKLIVVWCSINNDIIASVTDNAPIVVAPQTTLSVSAPFIGPIRFKAYEVGNSGNLSVITNPIGKFAITLDFVGIV